MEEAGAKGIAWEAVFLNTLPAAGQYDVRQRLDEMTKRSE